jgi:PEP-CTERM motif
MLSATLPYRGKRYACLALVTGCLLATNAATHAETYDSFLPIGDIRSSANLPYASTHTFDGSTGYFITRGPDPVIPDTWAMEISKVTDVGGGGQARTTLVSTADWLSYTGSVWGGLPGSRAQVVGSSLQFLDQNTDSIYRADTTTGALSTLVSSADIMSLTGLTELQVREETAFDSLGNMYFYEDRSDQILTVDTAGVLSVFVDKATLQTAVNDASLVAYVSGGMAFDWDDNLYWTLSSPSGYSGDISRGSIYTRSVQDGTFSKALTMPEVVAVSKTDPFYGVNHAAFNDMILGTDGRFYIYERGNDSMIRFGPEDPVNTLELVFDRDELLAGPMSSENINSFAVFGSELTWTGFTAEEGIYSYTMPALDGDLNEDGLVGIDDLNAVLGNWNAGNPPSVSVVVPEPSVLMLAGVGGMALLSRRR